MFRFTQEPSWGSQSQWLAKITGMIPLCVASVMAAYATTTLARHSGTIPVILASHWLWLPDDGSCVKRNISEQIFYF